MKTFQKIATLIVVVLLLATGYGLFRTKSQADTAANSASTSGRTRTVLQVDQSTFWTARWLAQMPTTVEERQVAEDALHLADKDMDLAFATAVREVEQHPPALSAEAEEIEARLQQSENCRGSRPGESRTADDRGRKSEREARKTNWMTG